MQTATVATPTAKPRRISAKEQAKQQALARLHELLQPGDTVYTICRHVSRSGMMRHIDVMVLRDGDYMRISHLVAAACDYRTNDSGALKVTGCGMDMGFSVVYDLSYTMFPQGFEETRTVNGQEQKGKRDGGYAISQRWL